MTTRTSSATVIFRKPFMLDGVDGILPAGSYIVDTEEEQLDTFSMTAWRRVATIIQLKRAGATDIVTINPEKLREALARDSIDSSADR
jgi:hypothetical protein